MTYTVNAFRILPRGFFVATCALRGRQFRVMRGLRDSLVTIDAIQFAVHGGGIRREWDANPLCRLAFFAWFKFGLVTIETFAVGE